MWLGDSTATYKCIVYTLIHVPEDASWLLKALTGLELTSQTQLAPTIEDYFSKDIGTLELPQ